MLEILVLINLCKKIGENARAKGRSAGGYQFLLVAMWFGFEIGVALCGGIILAVMNGGNPEDDGTFWVVYVLAIGGAALGAVLAFQIVARLPDADDDRRWHDDDRDDDANRYDR